MREGCGSTPNDDSVGPGGWIVDTVGAAGKTGGELGFGVRVGGVLLLFRFGWVWTDRLLLRFDSMATEWDDG